MSNALNLGDIVLPGDGYPSLFGFQIPVISGLEGAFLHGDGLSMLGKNYAPGKLDATVVGSPVTETGFASLSGAAYLETDISESAAMTIIAVARDSTGSADTAGAIAGNLFSTSQGGAVLQMSATSFNANAIRNATSDSISVPATVAEFSLVAYRSYADATPSNIKNITTGAIITSAVVTARTVDATRKLRVGCAYAASMQGPNDQALILIFSRALSDEEVTLIAAWARSYCAAKGITV